MPATPFRGQHLDRAALFVPDPYAATEGYRRHPGLEILKEHEHWASEGGPLMISSDNGQIMLALFRNRARRARRQDLITPRRGLSTSFILMAIALK